MRLTLPTAKVPGLTAFFLDPQLAFARDLLTLVKEEQRCELARSKKRIWYPAYSWAHLRRERVTPGQDEGGAQDEDQNPGPSTVPLSVSSLVLHGLKL